MSLAAEEALCAQTDKSEMERLRRELDEERALRREAEARALALEREFGDAIAARDDFLAAAAHDLRTPIAAVKLHVDSLLRHPAKGTPPIDERTLERLRAMGRQVRHLALLVDRLLDVSRLSTGKIELVAELVDLVTIARDVLERFEPDLEWARCALTFRAPASIIGNWDRTRIDQVLTNLISNAIKYGHGAPIEVELAATAFGARISVADHGVGIPPDAHARVFEKFERAAEGSRVTGLGLGLWIVRSIVEASGGLISLDSQPGRGSTFVVDLPSSPPVDRDRHGA